jgi:1,4-dihydroxy-2-naphthoate octaprenyltransferase
MEDGSATSARDQGPSEVVVKVDERAGDPLAPRTDDDPATVYTTSATSGPPTREAGRPRWAAVFRLPTLLCSVGPAVVAAALLWSQGARLALDVLALTLLAIALVHLGANALDAYLEHVRSQRPPSSSAGAMALSVSPVLAAGIYPLDVLRVAALLFVLGGGLGISLALAGGWPVLLLGAGGLTAAALYSATSYAFKRHAVGETAVFLALGPGVFALAVFAQHQPMTPLRWLVGVGLGLFALALVMASNLRALSPEIRDGRATLVRLLGKRRAPYFFVGALLGAYALLVVAAVPRGAPHGALAALLSLPVAAVPLTGGLRARNAATLALVVRGTLQAYAYFLGWLVLGLLLGGIFLRLMALLNA